MALTMNLKPGKARAKKGSKFGARIAKGLKKLKGAKGKRKSPLKRKGKAVRKVGKYAGLFGRRKKKTATRGRTAARPKRGRTFSAKGGTHKASSRARTRIRKSARRARRLWAKYFQQV